MALADALHEPRDEHQTIIPLLRKMQRWLALTDDEAAYLQSLHEPRKRLARGREIIVQGRPYDRVFLICCGVAFRHKVLPDGGRQGLNVVLPGDLIGIPESLFPVSGNTVVALTDVAVSIIPLRSLLRGFQDFPRIGAALFWSIASELAYTDERLVDLGRRSAYERLAHLVIRIFVRFREVGLAEGNSYALPLTQALMADLLGLSTPHLNRMVRLLREEGLATIEEHHVVIHDLPSLATLAGVDERYLQPDSMRGLLQALSQCAPIRSQHLTDA